MKQIAAIRTNKWTEEEERLLASLQPAFGEDLVVVFHNRPEGLEIPVEVVDISDEWVVSSGLRLVSDWGWRCGDYFYYRLRTARPEYDYYWLIEPDVYFSADTAEFFERFDGERGDALGLKPVKYKATAHRFATSLVDMDIYQAIFALTRFSGKALDHLFDKRVESADLLHGPRFYPNDELFSFSHIHAHPGMTISDLAAHASDWFEHGIFTPDPDVLYDVAKDWAADKSWAMHPVRGRETYKKALTTRLYSHIGFLRRHKQSLAQLNDADIEEIADKARDAILATLRVYGK